MNEKNAINTEKALLRKKCNKVQCMFSTYSKEVVETNRIETFKNTNIYTCKCFHGLFYMFTHFRYSKRKI